MYQYQGLDDTIAAISTPSGRGGIGIVRLSGNDALKIVGKIFQTRTGISLSESPSFKVHYGWVFDPESKVKIDEGLCTVMRGPKSYTTQDVVEISCHGGSVNLQHVLQLACDYGARLSEPGEFTKRAFLGGRIDLTQAEAVLDIIGARTKAFLNACTQQLQGGLLRELESIRNILMDAYVELEAIVNFPEDDVEAKNIALLTEKMRQARVRIEHLLATSDQGRIMREGIRVVLCGKPNVGKSSLLNVLLKTDRAIVSEIAGTTRDAIEEMAQIQGIPFQLIDTAGILEPRDIIEEEAIRRSRMYMQSAHLTVLVLDQSAPLDDQDKRLIEHLRDQKTLVIINKSDLAPVLNREDVDKELPGVVAVCVSAVTRSGMEELEKTIVRQALERDMSDDGGILVSNLRHIRALKTASQTLENALEEMDNRLSLEFISEEIKQAVNCLDHITGRNIDSDLLDTIFSQFCIGK